MNTCKGCGKEIVWGTTIEGKKIPLDPKPPIYEIVGNDFDGLEVKRTEEDELSGMNTHMVSHFATCSKANDFSGSKKK